LNNLKRIDLRNNNIVDKAHCLELLCNCEEILI